jgi:hypothetical protein
MNVQDKDSAAPPICYHGLKVDLSQLDCGFFFSILSSVPSLLLEKYIFLPESVWSRFQMTLHKGCFFKIWRPSWR